MKPPVFRRFRIFRAALKAYLTSIALSTTTPWLGTPPPVVGTPSCSGAAQTVCSSFYISVGPELLTTAAA
jgi:hypothetical protein